MTHDTGRLAELVQAVDDLIATRFPGEGGAAGVLLSDGSILTSTAPQAFNDSVELCHETGAYCEAYKLDRSIAASVCFYREADSSRTVLSPCGVCMERLAVHGAEVLVGVPHTDDGQVRWVTLREAHPFYWRKVFAEETPGW